MAREHAHLIGIGGTGMTALAGLLLHSGCRVTGSDHKLYPPTSTILERLGLGEVAGFDPENLVPTPDLIVVGNAISRGNAELEAALDRGLELVSMPAVVARRFLRDRHSIVIAGTHGKTTTASMTAWVLSSAGGDPGFLIGGSPLNFDLPFRVGKTGGAFVIEGDEYDTAFFDKGPKFMHYRPDTAVVGTVEFDHADIYRDEHEVKQAFCRLANLVPRRGLIVRSEDSPLAREVTGAAWSRVEGFGLEDGLWRAVDLEERPTGTRFRIVRAGQSFAAVELGVAGPHNVRNALAAAATACEQGLTPDEIAAGLASFKGVRRRLELRGVADGVQVFDDFAHHPTAIAETLGAVRRRYPEARVWAVVEPRSWSMRRNVFQHRLPEALGAADAVVVARVFGADAIPQGDRLDVEALVLDLRRRGVVARHIPDVEEIVRCAGEELAPGDVVVVMSNGGFDGLHERLLERLRKRAGASAGGQRSSGRR